MTDNIRTGAGRWTRRPAPDDLCTCSTGYCPVCTLEHRARLGSVQPGDVVRLRQIWRDETPASWGRQVLERRIDVFVFPAHDARTPVRITIVPVSTTAGPGTAWPDPFVAGTLLYAEIESLYRGDGGGYVTRVVSRRRAMFAQETHNNNRR